MNYLAAFLLLVAGDEESAFWLLAASNTVSLKPNTKPFVHAVPPVAVVEDIFSGYYCKHLPVFQQDAYILQRVRVRTRMHVDAIDTVAGRVDQRPF